MLNSHPRRKSSSSVVIQSTALLWEPDSYTHLPAWHCHLDATEAWHRQDFSFSPQTWLTFSFLQLSFQIRNSGKLLDPSSLLTVNPSATSLYSVFNICHVTSFLLFCSTTTIPIEATITSLVSLRQPPIWFLWNPSCSSLIHCSYCIWNKDTNFISLCCRKPFDHLPLFLNPHHGLEGLSNALECKLHEGRYLSFSILSLVLNIIFSMWKACDTYLLKNMSDEHFTYHTVCGYLFKFCSPN